MTAAETTAPQPNRGRTVGRFIVTLVIFALVGPIIGGLVTIAGLTLFGMNIWQPGDAMIVVATMMIYGLWIAYPLGIIPALVVGAVIAVKDIYGGTPFGLAAVVGLIAGLIWSRVVGNDSDWGQTFFTPVLIAASLIATIVCWRLTRRRRQAVAAP
jgi:hypothetical protein